MASEVKANKISPASGTAITLGDSGDTFTLPSGATIVNSGTATGFGGKLLKVYHVKQSGILTTTSTSATDLTGMTLDTDALASSSSRLLITVVVNASNSNSIRGCYFHVISDSTTLDIGDAAGSRARVAAYTSTSATSADQDSVTAQFLYSPSTTDAQTVKVQWWVASDTGQLNRSNTNEDDAYRQRNVSSIIVQEIGA